VEGELLHEERELMLTGIGGQGIQLAALLLARAALADGREVQLFGSYGGMMRGGETEATVIVADGPIESPPTISRTWSAIVMHHEHAGPTCRRLRGDGVVLVNSTVVGDRLAALGLGLDEPTGAPTVVEVPATELAGEVGSLVAASMVMLGAYAAVTGLVGLSSLVAALPEVLPSYRRQHVEVNEAALRAGHGAATPGLAPAWAAAPASAAR
jgi:Pyruvate/2-oxoacid:ferredoxin oxidoreductase gamma subunit